MKRLLLLLIMPLFTATLVFSVDFGLLTEQPVEVQDDGNRLINYSPTFTPWFSWNGGGGLSFYISGLAALKYEKTYDDIDNNDGWAPFRIELAYLIVNYRFHPGFYIEAGRLSYYDALGMTALGIFDGFRLETALPLGSVSFGAFYTGLLYKENAEIKMTVNDNLDYYKPWDWDELGAYFASRRFLFNLRWDVPFREYNSLSFEALAQFDLNKKDETLHSQYGEILAEFYPKGKIGLSIGALFEAMERNGEFSGATGALAQFKADVPGSLNDGITIAMKFSSGPWTEMLTGFSPLNSSAQGAVFPGSLSGGLALISAGYSMRPHRTFNAETNLRYFLRTYEVSGSNGSLYGGELWASLGWQPLDDIRFTVGGGAFFPGMGNVYPSGTDILWRIKAGLTLSF